jgi:hypothetical protein
MMVAYYKPDVIDLHQKSKITGNAGAQPVQSDMIC